MNRTEKVRALMRLAAEAAGLDFVREEQSGDLPPYPVMSYKILSAAPEQGASNIVSYRVKDEDKLFVSVRKDTELSVSVSFTGREKDFGKLWDAAMRAWDWIDSAEGYEAALSIGLGAKARGGILDRTAFGESEWEHKLGFDLELWDLAAFVSEADRILEVEFEIKE